MEQGTRGHVSRERAPGHFGASWLLMWPMAAIAESAGSPASRFPFGSLLALAAGCLGLWLALKIWRHGAREDESLEQRAVHEARERLAAIVESSDDAIIGKTLQGIITSWNPGAEKLFGYTAGEAIGQAMLMLIPEDRHSEEADILARISRGETVDHVETVRRRKDGSRIDVSATISPIRDEKGRVIGASKIARNITDRRLSRLRLEAQLERLNLLDQITRAIGERQDLQSIYHVVLRRLEDRLPVDFSCVLGHRPGSRTLSVLCVGAASGGLGWQLKLWEEQQLEIEANGLSACLAGELIHEPDTTLPALPLARRLADGGLYSLVAVPVRSDAGVSSVLLVCRRERDAFDSGECEFLRQLATHIALAAQQATLHQSLQLAYDELRQTQQAVMQQERLRALGQMASGVAHDINNAISPVLLYAETLLEHEPGLSPRARKYLQTIARSMDDVAATVARLREFYRQREQERALVRVQLQPLIAQVIELTRARWHDMPLQRGIVISMAAQEDPDLPAVMGVESEIREALINLVFNAVDAMPEGGSLTLRTGQASTPAGTPMVVLQVADTGLGMDEETRRRCMEPFFTTRGERGTGLGLAMVYGIAQRHGADLEIASTPGQGTTVSLNFPPAGAEQASGDRPEALPHAQQRPLHLLLVDDDRLVLSSMADTLGAEGHEVTRAEGGQAGISAFLEASGQGRPFDVVITDLGMPYVDGRQVARAIKQHDARVPVVLVTGWGQRLTAMNELPADVDAVLSKPPKLKDLREVLLRVSSAGAPDQGGP